MLYIWALDGCTIYCLHVEFGIPFCILHSGAAVREVCQQETGSPMLELIIL